MAQLTTYTVTGDRTERIDLTISPTQLRYALFQEIYARTGSFDDAGCEWLTDNAGNTYVSERAWKVSSDPLVATLVDAASIILFGYTHKLEDEDGKAD